MPPVSDQNGTSHSWISLPQAMSKAVSSLDKILNNDAQWQAFIDTKAIIEPVTMGVQSMGGDEAILVSVAPGAKTSTSTGSSDKADFTLQAQPQQWEKFFAADPVAPYTSFVGLQVCLPVFCPLTDLAARSWVSRCTLRCVETTHNRFRDSH
jgi:hypothetical protein